MTCDFNFIRTQIMPTHTEKRIMPYTAKQMYDLVADVEILS